MKTAKLVILVLVINIIMTLATVSKANDNTTTLNQVINAVNTSKAPATAIITGNNAGTLMQTAPQQNALNQTEANTNIIDIWKFIAGALLGGITVPIDLMATTQTAAETVLLIGVAILVASIYAILTLRFYDKIKGIIDPT